MINQLSKAINHIDTDIPVKTLKNWHIRQIIRQIQLRARKAMIPPFSDIEQYRGQGRLLSKLYAILINGNPDKLDKFLRNLRFEDIRKLMWQRFTSSSFTSQEYFPPIPSEVFQMIAEQDVEMLLRNLENQNKNCDHEYWDIVIDEARNRSEQSGKDVVIEVIDFYIDEHTWWNTYNFNQQAIYELRDRTAHGIRINLQNQQFFGVAEPSYDNVKFRTNF